MLCYLIADTIISGKSLNLLNNCMYWNETLSGKSCSPMLMSACYSWSLMKSHLVKVGNLCIPSEEGQTCLRVIVSGVYILNVAAFLTIVNYGHYSRFPILSIYLPFLSTFRYTSDHFMLAFTTEAPIQKLMNNETEQDILNNSFK